jgi:hypothetical protein
MTKKHFIALADTIRLHNRTNDNGIPGFSTNMFYKKQIETLADFCQSSNPNFNRERWLSYIAGECGPNGGAI